MQAINEEREKRKNPSAVVPLYRTVADGARLFARANAIDEAEPELGEALYREVVRLLPDHWQAWNNLGVVRFRRGDYAGARAAWHEALCVEPYRAEIHYNVGHGHRREGKLERAAACFARAVELDPEAGDAIVDWALCLQGLGRCRAALAAWRKYLAAYPRGEHAPLAQKHVGMLESVERERGGARRALAAM